MVGYVKFDEKKNQFIYFDINGLHFLNTRLRGVITTGEGRGVEICN